MPRKLNPIGREESDPTGIIYSVEIIDGKICEPVVRELGSDAVSKAKSLRKTITEKPPKAELDKIHPLLRTWLDKQDLSERHELIIVARETLEIPRFPEPAGDEPRTSPTNQRLLERAEAIVGELTERRAEGHNELVRIAEELDGKVVEQFWLVNAILVDIPLYSVAKLESIEEIVSIEPRYSEEPPPQNEPSVARGHIVSDPYFSFKGTFVGLLDTGVRATHTMFNRPDNLAFLGETEEGEEVEISKRAAESDLLVYVNINLVAFSSFSGDLVGQIFTMFVLTVAAAEAAIGLAILVVFFRNRGTIDVEDVNVMKG